MQILFPSSQTHYLKVTNQLIKIKITNVRKVTVPKNRKNQLTCVKSSLGYLINFRCKPRVPPNYFRFVLGSITYSSNISTFESGPNKPKYWKVQSTSLRRAPGFFAIHKKGRCISFINFMSRNIRICEVNLLLTPPFFLWCRFCLINWK